MSSSDFASLNLPAALLEAVRSLGFTRMTPVQAESLPGILAGKDLIVQADPGSGKTAAFGLGMLAGLTQHPIRVQALAVCPTRELADQVSIELRRLARHTPNIKVLTLCGGAPFGAQRASLAQGAHIVVGTPGRLEEHLRKNSLDLSRLLVLVLDEADRMLDMGFAPQLARVVQHAPEARQTLLFSATYPSSISELSRNYQRAPERITVPSTRLAPPEGGATDGVEERFYRVPASERIPVLVRWLASARPQSTLVFCNTRRECDEVASELGRLGWVAACIHSDLAQQERLHVMRMFIGKSCSVLAATDVAARGWDISELSAIVNLGLPRDPSVYLHRVGRTGRAGQPGLAVSLISEQDAGPLQAIERSQRRPATFHDLPRALPRSHEPDLPPMVTLLLGAGKKKKLRPGDVLGALTAEGGIDAAEVGAIQIEDAYAYVSVSQKSAEQALLRLTEGPVKGRHVKVRRAGLSFREPN